MAKGLIRGCGSRKKGGIYAEVPLSPFGMPFEYFLFDPAVVVDARELGLTSVGVKLLRRPDEEIYDVYDIIGAEAYPNVADFVEEGKRFGLSRRLAQSVDFSLLSEKSKLILLHSKAFIANPEAYHPVCARTFDCPKDIKEHNACWSLTGEGPAPAAPPSCIGLWYQDVEGGEADSIAIDCDPLDVSPRLVRRTMPSFSYLAHKRPDGVTPEYKLAIFGAFPIGRLAVINDPDGQTHEPALQKAKRANLQVDIEDE